MGAFGAFFVMIFNAFFFSFFDTAVCFVPVDRMMTKKKKLVLNYCKIKF